MSFKHAFLAVALAASSFAASAITLTPNREFSADVEFVQSGFFTDTYDFAFSWGGPGTVAGSISELRFGTAKDITFGDGAVQVIDANNNILLSLNGSDTGKMADFDIADMLENPLVIPTSTFTVVVKGNVIGTGAGGSTLGSYDFSIQAAPVPEAQTYAMMLAGLGVSALMIRRRRSNG